MVFLDDLLSESLSIKVINNEYIDGGLFLLKILLVFFFFILYILNFVNMVRWFYRVILIFVTIKLLFSVILIIYYIINQNISILLFQDAAIIWLTNIINFALWYWSLDGRSAKIGYSELSHPNHFDFPSSKKKNWYPRFFDYLFLSFTNSTALSPTDTNFISVRSKILMMIQALISMIVLVIIVARAINELG